MEMKTIRNLTEEYGVSRQKLQRLDQAGVLSPTVRASSGWLYDETAVRRLLLIVTCQRYGYSMKELKEVLSCPEKNTMAVAHDKLEKLKQQRRELDYLIRIFESGEELMQEALREAAK